MTPRECQCINPDCNLVVWLAEEVTRELKNPNWIILDERCSGSPPNGYKLIRRSTTYNIYSSNIKLDIEGAIETVDILNDPEMMEAIRQSEKNIKEGDSESFKQGKRELGL